MSLIVRTPNLDWLLLTKRPEEIMRRVPAMWIHGVGFPQNVWVGCTVEDQKRADERIPHLLDVPARVRFLSMEPLLGPVDLTRVDAFRSPPWPASLPGERKTYLDVLRGEGLRPSNLGVSIETHTTQISWVIAGGESGRRARPSHPDWFRALRDQCAAAGVPFLFKQWGNWAPGEDIERNRTDWTGMHEQHAEDGGAPKHSWPDAPVRETARRLGKGEISGGVVGDTEVLRVGKHVAGRLLDGVQHDGLPEVP
jgi:hypothetical protein